MEQYCIVDISHPNFGEIGTIVTADEKYIKFYSRDRHGKFVYVTEKQIARLA